MHRCSVIACARWETPYIREWLYYYSALGIDHVYLICNDDDPAPLYTEVTDACRTRPDFVTFMHFQGQGEQRTMYLDAIESARATSAWITFLDIDEFLTFRDGRDVNAFLDSFPETIDSVHINWLNFGNGGFINRPAGSVLQNYTRRAATVHPNTKHITRAGKLDPVRLARSDFPFWHGLPDPVWSDLRRVNVLGADMAPILASQATGNRSYCADPATSEAIVATAVIHHYVLKSEEDRSFRIERGIGGEFSGQTFWQQEYESGHFWDLLASINTIEDPFLANIDKEDAMAAREHFKSEFRTEPSSPVTKVAVQHPLWSDNLLLGSNGRVKHASHGSLGDYMLVGDSLCIRWDEWQGDLFFEKDGRFIHRTIFPNPTINLKVPQTVEINGQLVALEGAVIGVPGSQYTVELRPGTTDLDVFRAVFHALDYELPGVVPPFETILDLGANTGFSSVFFSLRYPSARILAVEPESNNYAVLARNTRSLTNITPVHAAIWSSDTSLSVQTVDASGAKLQEWAFQTREAGPAGDTQTVPAIGIATLMQQHGIKRIDLLKVDVEGAEFELFSANIDSWLPYTRNIAIETHERFRAGVDDLITAVLARDFDELPQSGENRVFVRRPGTLPQPG